jgi:hypothetical protein
MPHNKSTSDKGASLTKASDKNAFSMTCKALLLKRSFVTSQQSNQTPKPFMPKFLWQIGLLCNAELPLKPLIKKGF